MSEETENKEYLTKSMLKLWVSCPRKYYYRYIKEIESEKTESMIRGSKIHELIEGFYENAIEYSKHNDSPPTTMFSLIDDEIHDDWREYLDPYLAHFLGFERRRWSNVDNMNDWIPTAVEESIWRDTLFDDEMPSFTGFADVLLPAKSFDDNKVSANNGYVLIDFKTGEPKNENYRGHQNGGVMLDLAYYNILFESDYDIVSVGGYYPKTDTLITSKANEERRRFIKEIAEKIHSADPDNIEDYPLNQGPLCAWGEDDDQRCDYYDQCQSNWAEPIDNKDKTVELIKEGKSNEEIANNLQCTKESVNYWIHKKRWHRYRDD